MIKAILVCAVLAVANAQMNKVVVKNDIGGVCLDGSDPVYYFRAASDAANANKFAVFFQGGGWCYKEDDCYERSKGNLGSSNAYGDTVTEGGIVNDDASFNPEFHSWNHVYFAYCDGSSFSADREDPIVVQGKNVYFRGNRILKAFMNDLVKKRGMGNATDVIIAGCSAGGLSVYLHADQIKSYLPATARVKAAPFSGYFLNQPNANGAPVYPNQMAYTFNMMNISGTLNQKCIADRTAENKWECYFAENALAYAETPFFVMNSYYDSWSLPCEFMADYVNPASANNGNCSALTEWSCIGSSSCNADQIAVINSRWQQKLVATLDGTPNAQRNGMGSFLYSCYQHCGEVWNWNKIKINGVTANQALVKWFYANNEPVGTHTYRDCTWTNNHQCNPSCA